MPVLTRKPDQTIRIGDDIEVTVVAVRGEKVRLGITAPREVPIDKAEIAERRRREREGRPIDRITEQAKSDPLAAMVDVHKLLTARQALREIFGRALTDHEKQQLACLSEEADQAYELQERLAARYGVHARGDHLVRLKAKARVIWARRARTTTGKPRRKVLVRLREKVAELPAGTLLVLQLPDLKWSSSAAKRLRPGQRVELYHLSGAPEQFRRGGELDVFGIEEPREKPRALIVQQ